MRTLTAGKRYKIANTDVVLEVLKVNWSRALVRPVGRMREEFDTSEGKHVGFDKPRKPYSISANSVLEEEMNR